VLKAKAGRRRPETKLRSVPTISVAMRSDNNWLLQVARAMPQPAGCCKWQGPRLSLLACISGCASRYPI